MSKGVAGRALGDPRLPNCGGKRALNCRHVIVVTTTDACLRFGIDSLRRKGVLPPQLPIRRRILGQECTRKRCASNAGAKIASELLFDSPYLSFQGRCNGFRKRHAAIFVALSSPNSDLGAGKINVLDSQRCRFEYAETTAVHQHRTEPCGSRHPVQNLTNLVRRKDNWEFSGCLAVND